MSSTKWIQGVVTSLLLLLGACGGEDTPNSSPLAVITSPADGSIYPEGSDVSFTGTGSDSKDGTLGGANLEWSSNIDGQLGMDTAVSAILSTGNHTISLAVTDSASVTDTDTITITINTAPVVDNVGVNPGSVNIGASATLNWDITDADDDMLTCGLDFDGDGTNEHTVDDCANNTSQEHTYVKTGVYQIRLTVEDGINKPVQQSANVTVTIPPIITKFNATPDAPKIGDSVTFSWSITDTDSDMLSCSLDVDGDGTNEHTIDDCANSTSQEHTYAQVGVYQVRLAVDDGMNSPVQIFIPLTVTSTSPVISQFTAEPNPTYSSMATTFYWQVSDPDGDTLTCKLDINNDGADDYTINDCANIASQAHTYASSGDYTARLTVRDSVNDVQSTLSLVANAVRFKDVSVDIPFPEIFGDYGSLWGDFNNDNLLDLIYMDHGKGVLMLQQDISGKFLNVSSNAGLKYSDWQYPQQGDRHGGSCADYNNDGNIDLFIAHGAMRGDTLGVKYDELLQGNGDFTFVDVTHSTGTLNHYGRGRIGLWVDYDNDGWLDLYIANHQTNNIMYKNNGDGTFTDITDALGVGFLQSRAAWADYDMDGHIDLLLAWPLKLLRNTGQGYFEDVTKQTLKYEWIFGFGLAWGDFDNDADMDVFISRLGLRSLLLINDKGIFSPLENYAENFIDNLGGYDWDYVEGEVGTGVSWGDFDNDGDIDLFHVRSDGFTLYNNHLHGKFTPQKLGGPLPAIKEKYHGDAAVGDFNNDGLIDVAIDYLKGHVLLKNDSLVNGNWLKIRFNGAFNNTMGIGNKIWITKNEKLISYREYMGASSGLNSFGCGPVHVGLGNAKTVDIKVQWPNGYISSYYDVSSNKVIEIVDY